MTDIITIGEILIDLTQTGTNSQGVPLFAANPGGAPANVAGAAAHHLCPGGADSRRGAFFPVPAGVDAALTEKEIPAGAVENAKLLLFGSVGLTAIPAPPRLNKLEQ